MVKIKNEKENFMKKIFAILLAVCMLASVAAIFSIPAAAVENAWVVYGNAKDYREDFDEEYGDEYSNVPGYEYVADGLQTISPEWETTAPKVGVQTGDKVDLKAGVYMLVRIDEFSYDAADKWYAFSISDTKYVNVGSENAEKDGERIVAMVRGNDGNTMRNEVEFRYSNYKYDAKKGMQTSADKRYDADGKELLELVITWDGSSYNVTVNGAEITDVAKAWMNEHFADGEAYVGINIQNAKKGGDAGLTVLKYGTTADSALVPSYNDSQEPVKNESRYTIAPIADASTVAAGEPAIFLNGSNTLSDSKATIKDSEITKLSEEGYHQISSDRDRMQITFNVKNSVSYNVKDFPVVLVLTRDFCNCGSEVCYANEKPDMYLMAGDEVAAADNRKISGILPATYEPIECDDGNYLYFTVNLAEEATTADAEGRINGIRFDVNKIDLNNPGKNEFDICFVAFFRNEDEAAAYVYSYLGVDDPGVDNKPQTETETQTEDQTESQTETEAQTQAQTEPQTSTTDNDNASSGGCTGTVGFGAIAIVALASVAGFVTLKKKD